MSTPFDETFSSRTLGEKNFELTNHLGNVTAVVSDKCVGDNADIVSLSDYYPFGMLQNGRSFAAVASGYRYGFQGQEIEREIAGTESYSFFKYRISDNRLGRFFSVDPLSDKYPYNSNYAFSENRIIDGIELEGLEVRPLNAAADKIVIDLANKYSDLLDIKYGNESYYSGLIKEGQNKAIPQYTDLNSFRKYAKKNGCINKEEQEEAFTFYQALTSGNTLEVAVVQAGNGNAYTYSYEEGTYSSGKSTKQTKTINQEHRNFEKLTEKINDGVVSQELDDALYLGTPVTVEGYEYTITPNKRGNGGGWAFFKNDDNNKNGIKGLLFIDGTDSNGNQKNLTEQKKSFINALQNL